MRKSFYLEKIPKNQRFLFIADSGCFSIAVTKFNLQVMVYHWEKPRQELAAQTPEVHGLQPARPSFYRDLGTHSGRCYLSSISNQDNAPNMSTGQSEGDSTLTGGFYSLVSLGLWRGRRERDRERWVIFCVNMCMYLHVFLHLLVRKEHSALSLLISLTFHFLTFCLSLNYPENYSNPGG